MSGRPRVLFLAHLLPWPLDGGGQIKSYHTLRLLASRYDVTLWALIRRPEEASPENLAPLKALCAGGVKTFTLPRGKARDAALAAKSLATGRSFLIARDDVAELRALLFRRLREGGEKGEGFAAVHVDHLQMAQCVPVDTGGAKVVLDQHNIEHRIPQRLAETPGGNPLARWFARREWPRLRDFEIAACRRADRVLVVSPEDRDGLVALAPELGPKITVTPIGVDLDYWRVAARKPDASDLLTIGTMYWPPNVDSVRWFCADILPKVREAVPGVRFNVVGARPTAAVRALGEADPGVIVTGSVPDVRPYADTCGAFVVPLRSGSGMRVKILNALAMGLPVVSTTVGAEGIDARDGEHLLLADDPDAFAAAVTRLVREPDLAARLGTAGRSLMEREYAWDAVGRGLLSTYKELTDPGPQATRSSGTLAPAG